ncbi:MAG: murein biosynthesis integral membrane protein MurJ [Treponemataceae bacterium]
MPTTDKHSLLKHGSILSLLTLGSRLLGLVREMVKAAFLGTTALSDAFTVAFMIPNLLRRLFAEGSVSVALIPTFKEYKERGDAAETREFLSATFTVLLCFVSLTVALGIALAPLVVSVFGTDFSETTLLTRMMFPYLAFISIAAFFQGILNGVGVFAPTGFTPILFNLCVIGVTAVFAKSSGNPARAMAIGVLIGGAVQALFQLPYVLREGFRFSLTGVFKALKNPGTETVLRLIGPTIIGMAAYQLNDVVSTALAGNAGAGVASSLQYSLRMQELILGIFAVSIGTVILPELAGRAARGEWEMYNERLAGALRAVILLTIPVTAFSLVMGEHLISLLFKTGSFTDDSVRLTLGAFRWHIGGLLFIAANRVIAPAFYARKDSVTPTWAGIASFAVNIVAAVALVGPFSGPGIAAALSISGIVNTVLLLFALGKKEHANVPLVIGRSLAYTAKIAAFSAAAVLPIIFLSAPLSAAFKGNGRLVAYGVPIGVCALIFGAIGVTLLTITKDSQATALFSAVNRKLKKK